MKRKASPITLLLLSFTLSPCNLSEDVSPYISSFTMELVMLNLSPPEVDGVDFEFQGETSLIAFLGDVTSMDNFEEFPVEGAVLSLTNPSFGSYLFTEEGDGVYRLSSLDQGKGGLTYNEGDLYTFKASIFGEEYSADIYPPPSLALEAMDPIPAGSSLTVDLSGKDYDRYLVTVIDQEGVVTYTNLDVENPDAAELYEMATTEQDPVIEIPGSAFPRQGFYYAVGVAGMKISGEGEFSSNVNVILSRVMAGSASFTALMAE